MGRWLKNTILSVLATIISVNAVASPVFATTTNPTETTPNTSTTAPTTDGTTTPNTTTPPTNNTTTPSTTTPSTNNATTPSTGNTTNEEETADENESTDETKSPTCYDQVGGIGWLVCPGSVFFANVIDGSYNILENLLRVNPLPSDPKSPVHVVWDYIRGITNLVFVIFFLVIIFSQLTGFGITNYGIKRMLPRLIVAAILINLSYTICTLAVDLSNILGIALRSVFANIETAAITNGTINEQIASISFAGIVATILGVGTIGTAATLAFAGGIAGLIWLLIPIIFAGAIAIISAVITMAARQALIFLLVMISPLAFVCYLLPNTERWFRLWYQMFFRMIFFYPLFSILYGASQLAGFVTITSATSWIGVVLGIAIQVLPLFFAIPLMRMSGTVLGGIDGLVRRATDPATGLFRRYAAENQALARARQLNSTNNIPHNRLARWLEQRRTNREFDLQHTLANNKDTYMTRAATGMIHGRGHDRRLDRRGIRYYNMIEQKFRNTIERTQFETDMDEGFSTSAALGPVGKARITRINEAFGRDVVDDAITKARQRSVTRQNTADRADKIRAALSDENERVNSDIYRQVTDAFRRDRNSNDADEKLKVKRAVNDVLAEAISQKSRVDSEMEANYLALYDASPSGSYNMRQLIDAITDTKDYNSAKAALLTMAKRGDHGDIIETLTKYSDKIADDYTMQKNLSDACLALKNDNLYVWAWAKANMIRRSMSERNDPNNTADNVAPYIDFKTFLQGKYMAGDGTSAQAKDNIQKATLQQIFDDLSSWAPVASQDRTVYKQIFKMIEDGTIPIPVDANGNETILPLLIPEKHFRTAAVSGLMDGEQLAMHDRQLLGGFSLAKFGSDPLHPTFGNQSEFFRDHQAAIHARIISYLNNMVQSQLATSKSSTIKGINAALLEMNPANAEVKIVMGKEMLVSRELLNLPSVQAMVNGLNKPNATHQRTAMNKEVREMLGVNTDW
ncbi:MFS transporter [Candidatus Saccharibacteria bacterium]|nr:MFS transporter [Candidatus Saccharibacteria bacterium]